jgi:seryl-tRNA synthetase
MYFCVCKIPDGPVQIRKLLQSLSAEIASNKKVASKAARDREHNAEQDATLNKKSKAISTEKSEKEKEEQEDWVQCDLCSKWRRLPPQSHPNYPTDLPESWTCSLNTWDKNSSCSKPEDSFTVKELSAGAIKIRIWARRLKAADKVHFIDL